MCVDLMSHRETKEIHRKYCTWLHKFKPISKIHITELYGWLTWVTSEFHQQIIEHNKGEERQVMTLVWWPNPNPTSCRAPYFLTCQPAQNPRRHVISNFIHPRFFTTKISTIIHSFILHKWRARSMIFHIYPFMSMVFYMYQWCDFVI